IAAFSFYEKNHLRQPDATGSMGVFSILEPRSVSLSYPSNNCPRLSFRTIQPIQVHEGAPSDVPQVAGTGVRHRRSSYRRSPNAWHLHARVLSPKRPANLCLRFCRGPGFRGISTRARIEPHLLADLRGEHRDVGRSEPRLDVLRSGAPQRTAHDLGGTILIRFGKRADRDNPVPGPGQGFSADRPGIRP